MTLQPFASAAQMEEKTEGAIPADTPFLDTQLRAASTAIRNYCGWHIFPVIESSVTLPGKRWRSEIVLPTNKLISITSILDGGTLVSSTVYADLWYPDGIIEYFPWTWGSRTKVTFTHGFDVAPEDLTDLTLIMAARSLVSPTGAVREQVMQSNVAWTQGGSNAAGGTYLLQHEKNGLAYYKLGRLP